MPHFPGIVAVDARADQHQRLGLTRNLEILAAEVDTAAGQTRAGGVEIHRVAGGETLQQLVGGVRVVVADLNLNRAVVELTRLAVDGHGERLRGSFDAVAQFLEFVQGAGREVAVPLEEVRVSRLAHHFSRRKGIIRQLFAQRNVGLRLHVRHVEGQWHGPGRDVVKQTVLELGTLLKNCLHHFPLRLVERHDEGVILQKFAAFQRLVFGEFMHSDVVAAQNIHHFPGTGAVVAAAENVGFHGFVGVFIKIPHIIQQLHPHGPRRPQRGERGRKLVANRKGESEQPVVGFLCVATRTRLLEQNTDAAVDVGIGRAFAVVKVIVVFLGVVVGADFVEFGGVVGADFCCEVDVQARRERMGARGYAGLEEEGRIAAHLVVVGQNIGLPGVVLRHAALAFGVLCVEPVAVQVEPVMIRASAGPHLVVLARRRVGHGRDAFMGIDPTGKAVAAIGIDAGVEQNDALAQQRVNARALRRRQVVGRQQRGVGSARFVAMDRVAQPDHGGHIRRLQPRRQRRVDEFEVFGANVFQIAVVGRVGNREQKQRPLLVGAGILGQRDALGEFGQFFHVGHALVVRHVPFANLVAQKLLRRGNRRIVGNIIREIIAVGDLRLSCDCADKR